MIPKLRAFDEKVKEMVDVSRIEFDSEKIFTANGYKSLNDAQNFGFWQGFKSFILMQSTGLKDKNGTEIYEGDIVKVTDEDESTDFCDGGIGTINGLDELFMWYIDGEVENGLFDINQSYYIEVIGNIYENPELLEGAAR